MAHIIFYEKPGCINNTKQKSWLEAAGHDVDAVDILKHAWSAETLKPFFGKKPIAECFNTTAPVIKSGELDPLDFSETDALKAMIKDPILIKRPLMAIDNVHFLQGFDKEMLHDLIGLSAISGAEDMVSELEKTDLTTCPQLAKNTSCDELKASANSRPLGLLIELVEAMGLEVTYAYDDLVFVAHSAFMFQFSDGEDIHIYFNKDCSHKDAEKILSQVETLATPKALIIKRKGTFSMRQKANEESIELEFFDEN